MLAYQNQRLYPSMPVAGFDKRVYCEGGSTAVRNGMRYHVFTSSGTLTVVRGGTIYAMIVAAGGGTRSHNTGTGFGTGAGGGGGLANYLPVVVPEGSYQTILIGQASLNSRGGDSSITCLRPATLTGGGTSGNSQYADGQQNGGSGGGINYQWEVYGGAVGIGNTPAFIPSQGNNGAYASLGSTGGGGGGFSAAANGRAGGQGLALDSDTLSLGALINNNTHFSSGGGGAGDPQLGGSPGTGGTGAGNGSYGNDATSATMYGCGAGGGPNSLGAATSGYQGIVIIRYPVN